MCYLEMKVDFRREWKRYFFPLLISVVLDLHLAVNSMKERKNLRVSDKIRQLPEKSYRLEVPLRALSGMHCFLHVGF